MPTFAKRLLILVTVLFLIAMVSMFLVARSTTARVSTARTKIRSTGDKVLFTEYATSPIPNEENAYYHLMQVKPYSEAFEKSLMASSAYESGPPVGYEFNPALLADLTTAVREAEAGFTLLETAADATGFRSKIDHSAGYGMVLDHGPVFRSAGRMLEARAITLASEKKGDEALRACMTGLKLQQLVCEEPMLIQLLMAISVQNQMCDAAHHVLVSTPTSADVRQELDALLATIDNEAGLVAAFKAERAIGLLTFDQMREGTVEGIETHMPSVLVRSWVGQAYFNDDESAYVRVLNQLIECVGKPRSERRPIENAIEEELSQKGFRKIVTKLTVPALGKITDAQEIADTKVRCLRLQLRLCEADGLDLDSLPNSIRIDPISRKPLIVTEQSGGWLTYGVGNNEQDDGGDFTEAPSASETLDVGYGPVLLADESGTSSE